MSMKYLLIDIEKCAENKESLYVFKLLIIYRNTIFTAPIFIALKIQLLWGFYNIYRESLQQSSNN